MEYRILGPFDIRQEGESLHLGGGRQRALLALLVLHANTVVSIDRIIDSLWEEDPPDTAANIIQVYMSRLRKLLDPDRAKGTDGTVLLTRRPGYLIRLDPSALDAFEFSRLAAEGREALTSGAPGVAAALFSQGLEIWHGDVLADFSFEQFARAEVDRLEGERIAVTEDLFEARLALGQHEEVVGEIENAVREHPLRESLWAKLMLALYRGGRQAEALRTYQRAADTLVEELGIDPSPMLQELEDDILQQSPKLELPRQATTVVATGEFPLPLIGREIELAAIADALVMAQTGRSVLINLIGEPGSGVGRLLEEVGVMAGEIGIPCSNARAFEISGAHPGEVIDQLHRPESGSYVMTVSSAHHADPTSVGLLRSWMTDGTPKLLVLGTEPSEGRAGRPLRQLETAVSAVGTVISLKVGRLTRDDLDRWLDHQLAEDLFELTSGYPYELGEVLLALRRAGAVNWDDRRVTVEGPMPESVYQSLAHAVQSLGLDRRRLVESVALADTPIPLKVAAALLDLDDHEALRIVEELVGDGFLAEAEHGVVVSDALQSGRLTNRFGDMRSSSLFGGLLDAYDAAGVQSDATTGRYALAGGRFDVAVERLMRSGLAAAAEQHLGEAQPLLEGAIEALRATGRTDDSDWGAVHLALAQCHRLAGWPELAAESLSEALPHSSGAQKIDALGWSAQVADDQQNPVGAEWFVAAGEREAAIQGELAKLGSLLSLRGRVLSRLGFADESDVVSQKAQQLLETHGGPPQLHLARYNRAWIAFDRGDARTAESLFASMIDALSSDDARFADLSAWWSRSLFKVGRVSLGLEVAERAIGLGQRAGDIGPVFLGHMSVAEGAGSFGHGALALEAATEMLGLVLQQLPAWENAARYLLARAHLALGDLDQSAAEIANAIDLCPLGINGDRWRQRCLTTQYLIDFERSGVVAAEVLPLAQSILPTMLVEPAIELLTLASRADGHAADEMAAQAASLAVERGLVRAAHDAVAARGLWASDVGAATRRMVQAAVAQIPEGWPSSFGD